MTARTPSRRTLKLLLAAALPLFACGPVNATSAIGDAEIAVTRAHAADGDQYAVYETTSADLYLYKAREEQGHAHYGAAEDLARKSEALGTAAWRKAAQARSAGSPPPVPRATITHEPADAAPVLAPAPGVAPATPAGPGGKP